MMFDPFEKRLCRDVRNRLGHAFVASLRKKDNFLFRNEAADLQHLPLTTDCNTYIDSRQIHLEALLKIINFIPEHPDRFYGVAALLWNRKLFFEVHEWLEEKWRHTQGEEKNCLQALIMAATVFEQISYHREQPAQKLAVKTIVRINDVRALMPPPFDPDLLVRSLSNPALAPPVF